MRTEDAYRGAPERNLSTVPRQIWILQQHASIGYRWPRKRSLAGCMPRSCEDAAAGVHSRSAAQEGGQERH